ncbi:MAG TPA: LysR family transcriptional regulator, partial [Bdellovibrionales bacterium]|nr:LysR family transcriptional regulator [Bdellovibrionales bacterium]
ATEMNFISAAKKAAMTQSGVSQQVAKLEEQVGVPLFDRINKKVLLTTAGRLLLEFIEQQHDQTERLLERLSSEARDLQGLVRYAMPHSCLMTPHFPILLQMRNKGFSGVKLKVTLCPTEEVIERLLARDIDFGFVTKRSRNPAVRHQVFAEEQYVLIGPKRTEVSAKSLASMPFIDHPGMAELFDSWRRHHLPSARKLSAESLNLCGTINGLHGALTMVSEGLGYTVVPRHCAQTVKGVWIYEDPAKPDPSNQISIVSLFGVRPTQRVQAVLGAFWKMKES